MLPEKTTTSKNKSKCPGTCHNKREEDTIGTPSTSRMQKKEGRKDTSVQMAILKVSCGSKRKERTQTEGCAENWVQLRETDFKFWGEIHDD